MSIVTRDAHKLFMSIINHTMHIEYKFNVNIDRDTRYAQIVHINN